GVAVCLRAGFPLWCLSLACRPARRSFSLLPRPPGSTLFPYTTLFRSRSRVGFAVRLHRGAVVSWGVAAIVVAGAFGALTDAASEAVSGNETLQDALGGSGGSDGYSAMMVLLLGVLCAGYAVQAVATLRAEETAGRLEVTLSSEVSRTRWFVMHVVVVVMGLLIV